MEGGGGTDSYNHFDKQIKGATLQNLQNPNPGVGGFGGIGGLAYYNNQYYNI